MNKKAFILCSAGVLTLGLLVATNAGVSNSKGIIKADDEHSQHNDWKEVGFDWKNPTQTGYKPYWRCATCCPGNPAASRYDYTNKKALVNETSITLNALASSTAASGDGIANVDNSKSSNVDNANGYYVKVDSKDAIYFSRSRKLGSNDEYIVDQFDSNPSTFGFSYTSTSEVASPVTSVTFVCRYKSWNNTVTKVTEGTDENAISYSSLCQFTYGDDSTTKSFSLDKKVFNDDAWHSVTITAKEVGVESFASLKGITFKFADLRGYFMMTNLTYGTDAVDSSLNVQDAVFGSVDTSDVDSAITDCSIGDVKVYKEEACTNEVTSSDSLSSLKKVYVKVPLAFETITTGGRTAQDYGLGRLYVDIDFNSELISGANYCAQLNGYTTNNFFKKHMIGKFIDSSKAGVSKGMTAIGGTMDTAISKSGISALITIDFSSSSAYALEHTVNAFSIKAKWSAYLDSMYDSFSDVNGIRPVAYVIGSMNGWKTNDPIYQMVPSIDSADAADAVVWHYLYAPTEDKEIKVLHNYNSTNNTGWNGCASVEGTSDTYSGTQSNGKIYANNNYRIVYITGESTFKVKKAA